MTTIAVRSLQACAGSSVSQRERTLGDDEIRTLWRLAGTSGSYGAFLKTALLTAQRSRQAVRPCAGSDVDASGVWHIPREAREKQTAGDLKLPPSGTGYHLQPAAPGWRRPRFPAAERRHHRQLPPDDRTCRIGPIHDLRRTARSLLSPHWRVRPKSQNWCSAIQFSGIQKVYDRHSYFEEKAQALSKLASLIERIVDPPSTNVVTLGAAS